MVTIIMFLVNYKSRNVSTVYVSSWAIVHLYFSSEVIKSLVFTSHSSFVSEIVLQRYLQSILDTYIIFIWKKIKSEV